ncbi:MAG: Flp pilus assembly protein CpaB [Sulfitobacter sp.]
MRMVFGLVLLVGIALAGGAVYLAKDRFGQYQVALARAEAAKAKIVPTETVFVAERTLKYGEKISLEDVREVQFPITAIPEGAFKELTALFPETTDEQRVVLRAMEKDEVVLSVKVTEPGEDAGLTSRLERGMRAFAIKVDVSSGVSGFLRPGDRVDVYWTGNMITREGNGNNRSEVTKLIEPGVKLIAVDQTANGQLDQTIIARTVTVAVSPNQVAALAQAQSSGKLSLSLVGAGDDTIASAVEVDQRSLLGIETVAAAPVAPQKQVCTTRVRRGAEVVSLEIPCTN